MNLGGSWSVYMTDAYNYKNTVDVKFIIDSDIKNKGDKKMKNIVYVFRLNKT